MNEKNSKEKTKQPIPPNLCEGCQGRDRIIKTLAEEVDRQNQRIADLETQAESAYKRAA